MALVRPFKALRPKEGKAASIASLPYDVMNREEAKAMAEGLPHSFLHVVRAEIDLPDSVDIHADEVYVQSRKALDRLVAEGLLLQDPEPAFYFYTQIMDGRSQTGLVATASVQEYRDGKIKKHELTRVDKLEDRIRHFDACDAHTAPIFLAYRQEAAQRAAMEAGLKASTLLCDFTREDGVQHICRKLSDPQLIQDLVEAFADCEALYIADGHHRCASAAKVADYREQAGHQVGPDSEFMYFMAVIFPDEALDIMDYNRLLKDLNGMEKDAFLEALRQKFTLEKHEGTEPYRPQAKGRFGMYLDGSWYALQAKPELLATDDPVEGLDVQILQREVLAPLLGIEDPRTSTRIDFVGGIRGLKELERRCQEDMALAFSFYPTRMQELLDIADSGQTMPPKSTWFEPKLLSGLFVHRLS